MHVIAASDATKQFGAAHADTASLIEAAPRSWRRHRFDNAQQTHSRPSNPSIGRLAQNQFIFGPSVLIGLVLGWAVITRPDLIVRRQGLAFRPSGKPWRGRISLTISDYREQCCGRRLTAPADVESPAGKPGDSICRYWLCELSPRGTVNKTGLRTAKAGENACDDGARSCVARNLLITGHARKSLASRVCQIISCRWPNLMTRLKRENPFQ